jgi:hypothetical protein
MSNNQQEGMKGEFIESNMTFDDTHYEKLHVLKPHYPIIRTQKKLIYNYCETILWVLKPLCKYPFRNMGN